MADFISQLSGPEMDNALQEVNAHNAEAWSSGTRGGVQVESGDPTYDNNAKYWAQVAKSAVPPGSAGAVLFSQAQQLPDSAKAQARANISAGGSNPNLFDNAWFQIDQRQGKIVPSGVNYYIAGQSQVVGVTTQAYNIDFITEGGTYFKIDGTTYVCANSDVVRGYIGAGYTVDRWLCDTAATTVIGDDYIQWINNASVDNGFTQRFEGSRLRKGETYTLTIEVLELNGGTTAIIQEFGGNYRSILARTLVVGVNTFTFTVPTDFSVEVARFIIIQGVNGSFKIRKKVKLEQANYSTWATDVPPNEVNEWLRCLPYYYDTRAKSPINAIGVNTYAAHSRLYGDFGYPVKMRTVPSITIYSLSGDADAISYWASAVTVPGKSAYAWGSVIGQERFNSIGIIDSTTREASDLGANAYAFHFVANAEL